MKVIHQSKLKRVELTLALGDLFNAKVDAIVNSEQTDFILSGDPHSISGQIWHRFGHPVQSELNDAKRGEILSAGTVLETSGGGDFSRIFHAGFHEPDDWPGVQGGSEDADYFEAIGSCVRQILDSARRQKLRSVAFPLIGCGLFGLDVKMLFLQFVDAVEALDERLADGEHVNVWLVVYNREQLDAIVDLLFGELLRYRSETIAVKLEQSGVPILDRFAARLALRSNQDWVKWQLCRFTEIALEFMCYGLCRAVYPQQTPVSLLEEGTVATFGFVRDAAIGFANSASTDTDCWGVTFFKSVLRDDSALDALKILNQERNNLAHGRKSLQLAGIERLVFRGLRLDEWSRIIETDGELRLIDWSPWVASLPERPQFSGLFERWQKTSIRYLVPEIGEIFKLPNK